MQQKRIKARKSLGQHFLNDRHTIQKIVDSLELMASDTVLEIGCGTGALTKRLVGITRRYLGVEVDTQLFRKLDQTLASPQAVFINQDILTLDWHRLAAEQLLSGEKIKVVGNLPYNISSPIITQLARHADLLEMAVIMLQAEVADRLVGLPGSQNYGVLTVLAQYYFECKLLFLVRPRAFIPQPKVASQVVRLTPRTARSLSTSEETPFLGFVKRCFSQRRKTLLNCLRGLQHADVARLREFLKRCGYPLDVRAERISLNDFIALYSHLGRAAFESASKS
jgi:16S rRNA (adenine1518-N6/adenine1519-N6)-dimethyltransferase